VSRRGNPARKPQLLQDWQQHKRNSAERLPLSLVINVVNLKAEEKRMSTNIKELTFEKEKMFFSEYACFSCGTAGRDRDEKPDALRTEFQRDRDRIMHSKAFRRLKNKTQVFLAPKGDHYRTRMTHTLDVTQVGRSIARALRLNEELVEAICLAHDLGHPPFGHTGERVLSKLTDGEFKHNEQSVRVVEVLENNGQGLNLTKEVRDGILHHRTGGKPGTLEGKVVMFEDKNAYINHDLYDALRAGVLKEKDLPKDCIDILGKTSTERINTMITAIYNYSLDKPLVEMEPTVYGAMLNMRKFLFDNVYFTKEADAEWEKAQRLLDVLYNHFYKTPSDMPQFFQAILERDGAEKAVCDYIASMSDSYATSLFADLYLPKRWEVL
jgi:dGTPase